MSAKRCNVAVLASGTGSNFRAIAQACRQEAFPARAVCLISDNPGAGALDAARSLGIDAHTVRPAAGKAVLPAETEEEIVELCSSRAVDLIALAGFMRILRGPLLGRYEGQIMNIHPSLLPSFPGLHAARQALQHGVRVTGCTVHFVDRTVDGGAIILQAAVPIESDDTEATLLDRIHREEHRIYVEAIRLFAEGRLRREGRRVTILSKTLSNPNEGGRR